jgi:hypothetical protein
MADTVAAMHSLGDMSKALNRPVVELSGLQNRFELPVFEGAAYSPAYLAFLRTVVHLRTLHIGEAALLRLWALEKKLMQLVHVDSTGSNTWFLDACGSTGHRNRRLLLSQHDLGVPLPSAELQLGLNFAETLPELFAGTDMGEDALRVLRECLALYSRIRSEIAAELPQARAAVKWAATMP